MSGKILVIEDDADINELMGQCLEQAGMRYVSAVTGEDGLKQAEAEHPDVVILDLMLPDIHGFEVARRLSEKRDTSDIAIVVLSCMCQDCDRKEAFGAGALSYMNKPFNPKDMIAAVQSAMTWKAQLKTRPAKGMVIFGGVDPLAPLKAAHEMEVDLFTRTSLSDEQIKKVHEGVGLLNKWAKEWNHDQKRETLIKLDYQVTERSAGVEITCILSENESGLLFNDFFKAAAPTGIMAWNPTHWIAKPAAPVRSPAHWTEFLADLGADQFEKDASTHTLRFSFGIQKSGVENGAGLVSGA